ncbi:MAG: hypothetical protein M5U28_50080 [Sandaracinaceae bacterium]|nr:hypothetical protein [Sandaracinaceae bacterium]
MHEASNTETGSSIPTITPTAMSGRAITWSGRWTHASSAGAQITIAQAVTYEMADRAVRVDVTLTNTGTVALSDVTYGRRGEPDQGSCNIGSDFATLNDVVRSPPTDASALVTATTTAGVTPTVILGVGSFDTRMRSDVGSWPGGIAAVWTSPRDPNGAAEDTWIQWAFREPSLAVGASTTFTFFYVFGSTAAEVATRLDDLRFPSGPCVGLAEGAACTTGTGDAGLCRGGVCCTGCFDGTRCVAGRSSAACGIGGATCASCDDSMFCTLDACASGACMHAPDPSICDDGAECTMDVCDEATDSCSHPPYADVRNIGGVCVAPGTIHSVYPCQVCDPTRRTDDWSPMAAGAACGATTCAVGRLTTRACDGAGVCVAAAPMPCPTGMCADASSCTPPCTEGDCAAGSYCDATTMRCEPLVSAGGACADAVECASGICVDGVCCDAACDGTCERCDLAGLGGTCAAVPAGMDPDGECALACDGAGMCEPMPDAGPPDAGAPDAGPPDAGPVRGDAGANDAAVPAPDAGGPITTRGGCGCRVAPSAPAPWLMLGALAWALLRRRR